MKVTEVVFILDESGSMLDLKKDTIGGFNRMLREQKNKKGCGKIIVSTVLFSWFRKVLHDREDINNVKEMTSADYSPLGGTALVDAVMESINHITDIYRKNRNRRIPDHTLFVIITDGEENSSINYTSDQLKRTINLKQKKYNWEFMFVGANIDAIETAKNYGIDSKNAFNHVSDDKGTQILFSCLSEKMYTTRKAPRFKASTNTCMKKVARYYNRKNIK